MKRYCLGALILASAVSNATAMETFRSDSNWTVSINRDNRSCAAMQTAKGSGRILVQASSERLVISVVETKLTWLSDGQQYDVEVQIDQSKWNGKADATVVDGSGALHVTNPASPFVEAFARGNRLTAAVDGTRYGPYALSGTKKVLSDLGDCLAALDSSPPPPTDQVAENAADARTMQVGAMHEWTLEDVGKVWKLGDEVTVTTSTRKKTDGSNVVIFDVLKAGGSTLSFEVANDTTFTSGSVGLVSMQSWPPERQLFVTNFLGGAHCCTEVRIVNFSENGAKLIKVGTYDGVEIEPEDIDGDGNLELAVPDERFRIFSSYAGSYPPLRIMMLANGELVDKTRDPRFASYLQRQFERQSEACANMANKHAGACAGLVGTAANIGVLSSVIPYLDFETKSEDDDVAKAPISLCADPDCKTEKEFQTFEESLRFALSAWGYIDPETNEKFRDQMRMLVGKRFGDETPNSELGCEMGAPKFSESKTTEGEPIFQFSGYEKDCKVSSGTAVGTAIAMTAVCEGEGMPVWLESKLLVLDGNKLSIADFKGATNIISEPQEFTECSAKVAQ